MHAFRYAVVALAVGATAIGCSREAESANSSPGADSLAPVDPYVSPVPPQEAALIATLGRIGTGTRGVVYDTNTAGLTFGSVVGTVEANEAVRGDTIIAPEIDFHVCRPFRDVIAPRRGPGLGNAIVWLAGVERGIANTLPRRTSVRLHNCTLDPRVHIVAEGGTVIVGSRDAITAELRIVDLLRNPASPRALVSLNDFGQVVPSPAVAREPGLVQITDDRHTWVRGFVAVSAHPYIALTDATGRFQMDSVPSGEYQLIVFSEQLGVRARRIIVGDSATQVRVQFE